jgi:hypothetical protein
MKRVLFLFTFASLIPSLAGADTDPFGQYDSSELGLCDPADIDWPQTIHVDEEATSLPLEQVRLIGRLASGIVHDWVDMRNRGLWFECGLRYETRSEKEAAATSWAYHIVRAAESNGVNPWGLAGTIANESNFDRCAIGYHPRTWAVKHNMLKKKRRTISYSAAEVLAAYQSIAATRAWRDTGWDVGPCQMLSRFYPGSIEDMFTLLPGVDICAMEMSARSQMFDSKRGWRWWRGRETDWYDERITRHARRLGARRDEI